MNVREAFSSKRFRYGALSTAISAVFVVVIIGINVLMSVLGARFPMNVDLTRNQAFELSAASADYVKELKNPVTVSVLVNESQLVSGGDIYYSQIKSVIDQYEKYSKNISVEYVDIIADPTFAAKHNDQTLVYGDILLSSGERQRKISINDMFNVSVDQYTGQQKITSSKAEQMMTSAIMGVSSEDVVKVAFLTGNEEADMPALRTLLTDNNFEIADINITTTDIPADVEVAFMLAPTRDPEAEVVKKLDAYLENGGEYGRQLIYAANIEQPPLPNLEAFLADWGIGVEQGAVLETNENNILNYNMFFCLVEYGDSMDYRAELPGDIRPSMPFGRPLSPLFSAQSGYETTVLLSYSPTACIMPVDAPEDWKPTEELIGEVPAAIRSTFTRYEGNTPSSSNVFALSSVSAFESMLLGSRSISNAEYFVSLLNTVTEREDVITLAPKTLGGTELGITQLQATVISGLLIFVLPIIIIITGIVIWVRRRHR